MQAVAILGGLGSQMFKYAFYLQIKSKDEAYIDVLPYQLTSMWNGYELNRIFGIDSPELAGNISQEKVKRYISQGESYKEAGVAMLQELSPKKPVISIFRGYLYPQKRHKILYFYSLVYNKIKRFIYHNNDTQDIIPFICKTKWFSFYFDEINHVSDKYIGKGSKREELKKVFQFPDFKDNKNTEIAERMQTSESVALHVRRSDHMYDNAELFKSQYFAKAVNYIKKVVKSPVFYIFSDEPEWCRNHLDELGFLKEDKIEIIDWNKAEQSYRDMQLMTYCKHNILAISSFSWWGYYLSNRRDKVVCAPKGYWLEVPVHF